MVLCLQPADKFPAEVKTCKYGSSCLRLAEKWHAMVEKATLGEELVGLHLAQLLGGVTAQQVHHLLDLLVQGVNVDAQHAGWGQHKVVVM